MRLMRIAIVGIGLIGGSLGIAIRQRQEAIVVGIDLDREVIETALERGAIDEGTIELAEGVREADIIFMCTPVLQIIPLIERMIPFLKPGAILTDVGSTKGFLYEQILELLPGGIHYVGGHPMAGGEQSGIIAANGELFRDKMYILFPDTVQNPAALRKVQQVVEWTGATITTMGIAEHDRCAAVISHVPHVAAAALVTLLEQYPDPDAGVKLAGGGFRDTTRIASSNADMWADICLTNDKAIIDSLSGLQSILGSVIAAIQAKDRMAIHTFFYQAKQRRDSLINASFSPSMR